MNLLAIETSTDACSVALAIGDDVRVDHRVEPRRHARLVLPMIDGLLAEAGLPRGALDGIAFGRGPGSFTGVRIAASVTQGIALGLGIGVVGVSTLAAIAEGCRRELGDASVGVALDARLDEIYWGAFRTVDGLMRAVTEERVCAAGTTTLDDGATVDRPTVAGTPAAVAIAGEAIAEGARAGEATSVGTAGTDHDIVHRLAGPGAERYADILCATLGLSGADVIRHGRLPHARDTLALARFAIAATGLADPESAVPVYLRERVALTEEERGVARPPEPPPTVMPPG